MDTNKVLIFLAGAAVAYFVINQMDKQKLTKVVASAPPIPPTGINPNLANCETALTDSMMTLRFESAEALEQYKKDFMADCLQNPDKYLFSNDV